MIVMIVTVTTVLINKRGLYSREREMVLKRVTLFNIIKKHFKNSIDLCMYMCM